MLDGAKRMFNDLFALLHQPWIRLDSFLHPLSQVLMHPACNAAPLPVPGALRFDHIGPTGGRRIITNRSAQLDGRKAEGQALPCWAVIPVVCRIIGKLLFPIQAQLAVGRCQRFGDIGLDAGLYTGFDFLAMVVGLHPTSLLPGAIGLAETVLVKDYW
jgi:hypothetical protein